MFRKVNPYDPSLFARVGLVFPLAVADGDAYYISRDERRGDNFVFIVHEVATGGHKARIEAPDIDAAIAEANRLAAAENW